MRHLYLDRNQSYGERIIGQESTWCGYMDYMMKLRAKSWMSDSSTFHMLMNKGSSVHVFCIKRRIMNEADATNIGVQCGDYQMVWIDSFGSNTTQGGYETLSVIEASLIEAKKIFNNKLESISLFSDAGSGYKTTQCLLGIRNISNAHGVQIKRWHFNASGEGKRWETDGHNTDIKSLRESAMRAGCPSTCATPDQEVHAQCFDGGIDGALPFKFDFNYDQMTPLNGKRTWDGLQAYHDFEFLDDGSIRAWKSFNIGNGKVFRRKDLDAMYDTTVTMPRANTSTFPQGCTSGSLCQPKTSTNTVFVPKKEKSEKRKRKLMMERGMKKKARLDTKVSSNKGMNDIEEEEFQPQYISDSTTNDIELDVLMGGGVVSFKSTSVIDNAIKQLIRAEVQKGIEKSGDRKSVFEIQDAINNVVPAFMQIDVQEIQNCISSILQKGNKPTDTKVEKVITNSNTPVGRLEIEKRQLDAGILKHCQSSMKSDDTKGYLFLAKYYHICLIDTDGKRRVIVGMKFDEGRRVWVAKAQLAQKHPYDDRFSQVIDDSNDCTDIPVGRALSKYIKEYNKETSEW